MSYKKSDSDSKGEIVEQPQVSKPLIVEEDNFNDDKPWYPVSFEIRKSRNKKLRKPLGNFGGK